MGELLQMYDTMRFEKKILLKAASLLGDVEPEEPEVTAEVTAGVTAGDGAAPRRNGSVAAGGGLGAMMARARVSAREVMTGSLGLGAGAGAGAGASAGHAASAPAGAAERNDSFTFDELLTAHHVFSHLIKNSRQMRIDGR